MSALVVRQADVGGRVVATANSSIQMERLHRRTCRPAPVEAAALAVEAAASSSTGRAAAQSQTRYGRREKPAATVGGLRAQSAPSVSHECGLPVSLMSRSSPSVQLRSAAEVSFPAATVSRRGRQLEEAGWAVTYALVCPISGGGGYARRVVEVDHCPFSLKLSLPSEPSSVLVCRGHL